ncbi:bifunctional DNA primase/polymerase [Streptomyces iconiensis]|uniref:Bifunctional DNA primase/polymerase n=1 Tax=Streptomyces iconiensis TaxID=1384038 RepID=A0ABT7A550_9ACTN|nr:bifunctional DNA primase/polymerase [Streptomyces iconiensis]MDJ1136182.1 bifunctional DNA primase/polymerase [Streptomyces iconiensis]
MREILGRRRSLWAWVQLPGRRFWAKPGRYPHRSPLRNAALIAATEWRWPVVPGAALSTPGSRRPPKQAQSGGTPALCSCPDPDCVVPGAHPFDPVLLAATKDPAMIRWWWTNRPEAPVVLATGGDSPCALSLPAVAGARALAVFDATGVRVGPVVATPTRFSFLVAPYAMEELGDLLYAQDHVPSSLRFHQSGGYVALPPSSTGAGKVRWERRPDCGTGGPGERERPWLPRMESLIDVLIEESAASPDTGSRLAY